MANRTWRVKIMCGTRPRMLQSLIEGIENAGLLLNHVDVSVREEIINLYVVGSLQDGDGIATTIEAATFRESLLQIIHNEMAI
ncbi:hypothetical protein KP509_22G014700 [Ceratopteris richardii]|nr:hypothetical protein KP509_22G014700 [Ceratopteris richardii]